MTAEEMRPIARAFAMLDDMADIGDDLRAILEGEGLFLSERAAVMVQGLFAPHRAAVAALCVAMGAANKSEARAIARLAIFGADAGPSGPMQ